MVVRALLVLCLWRASGLVVPAPRALRPTGRVLAPRSATAVADDAPAAAPAGASVGESALGLAKNLIGAGTFAMPSAMSRVMATPSLRSLAPPIALMVAMASLSGYCFNMVGRATRGRARTLGAAFEDCGCGAFTLRCVEAATVLKCFSAALMYSIVLADLSLPLARTYAPALASRARVLAVTMAAATPLCLAERLDSLKPFSMAGLASSFAVVAFMALRVATPAMVPALPPPVGPPDARAGLVILLSTLATATLAHYNAPQFRAEIADPEGPGADAAFLGATARAFGLTALTSAVVAVLGVASFGGARGDLPGFILNAYGAGRADRVADAARALVYASFLTSFPFAFAGLKAGLTPQKWNRPSKDALAVGLLAILAAAGTVVTDAGFVVAFAGATLGSALTYVIPPFLLLTAKRGDLSRLEAAACKLIIGVGVAFMGLGGSITAKAYL